MIVPRHRLLILFALVALPAGLLYAGGRATIAFAATAALVVISALDAVLAARAIRAFSLTAPQLTRYTRSRAATFTVQLHNAQAAPTAVRLGVQLPEALECAQNDIWVTADAGGACEVALACVPRTRGRYEVTTAAIGVHSPAGLWEARRHVKLHSELRIYPDLLTGQDSVAPLLLRRHAGMHVQRQVGRGREFEKLREYLPGDPMSDIHWKATARRGKPVTRVYQLERTQEVYAVIDCSRLTGRTVGDDTILERYVSATLALTLASRHQGDLVGVIVFSDTLHTFLRAGSGTAHYDACRNALLEVAPRRRTPDYNEVFTAIQSRIRRRAMLVFLTELDDPVLAEDFVSGVRDVARRHLVAVASVPPVTAAPIFDVPADTTSDIYDRLAGHFASRRFDEVGAKLRAHGVRFLRVKPAQLGAEVARAYLNVKRQQIL